VPWQKLEKNEQGLNHKARVKKTKKKKKKKGGKKKYLKGKVWRLQIRRRNHRVSPNTLGHHYSLKPDGEEEKETSLSQNEKP